MRETVDRHEAVARVGVMISRIRAERVQRPGARRPTLAVMYILYRTRYTSNKTPTGTAPPARQKGYMLPCGSLCHRGGGHKHEHTTKFQRTHANKPRKEHTNADTKARTRRHTPAQDQPTTNTLAQADDTPARLSFATRPQRRARRATPPHLSTAKARIASEEKGHCMLFLFLVA